MCLKIEINNCWKRILKGQIIKSAVFVFIDNLKSLLQTTSTGDPVANMKHISNHKAFTYIPLPLTVLASCNSKKKRQSLINESEVSSKLLCQSVRSSRVLRSHNLFPVRTNGMHAEMLPGSNPKRLNDRNIVSAQQPLAWHRHRQHHSELGGRFIDQLVSANVVFKIGDSIGVWWRQCDCEWICLNRRLAVN